MSKVPSIDVGMVIPVDDGYGFSVVNEHRSPVVTFTYANREDAEEARALMDKVIVKAVSVVAAAPRRADRKAEA